MQSLAVDAALLRTVLASDIKLTIGRELMVRVASIGAEGRGVLSLAGMLLEAELPDNVRAGAELRLQVRELTPEKVVLAIQPDEQPPPAAPVEAPRVPLPGGGFVKVTERDAGGLLAADDQAHTVTVRYDAPNLGQIDLHFTLSTGALAVTAAVAPGAYETADERSRQLQTALATATARPVTVTVVARREPVEVFA
ncbi:MAG TPA: hypothetical protein VHU61_16870 [Solirubrobacteraceae bacterium]|jgi:hypothetical protein|nr:hypothetical protein [Solirubrobacteraceae bacterium]